MTQTSTGIRIAAALSDLPDTAAAADSIGRELADRLGGPADLVMVFAGTPHVDGMEEACQRLATSLKAGLTAGCTAEGVIGGRREIEEGAGLSVLAARLPGARLRPFQASQVDWSAPEVAQESIVAMLDDHGAVPKAMILLADPFSTSTARLLPTLEGAFPHLPIVGGMASAGSAPGGNRLFLNGQLSDDGAVGVFLSGDLQVDCVVSQGCRPIGKPWIITKSHRHVVQELGGFNALKVLHETLEGLSDADRELVHSNGLLVGRVIDEYKPRFGRGDFVIRSLVGVDQKAGYVAIGDPAIRAGQTVQFHVRDQRTALEDFKMLLGMQKLQGPAAGALLFSCNGRGTRLFEEPNADANMVQDALGPLPLAGFFAAGELGPIGGQTFIHGHTASLAVLRASAP